MISTFHRFIDHLLMSLKGLVWKSERRKASYFRMLELRPESITDGCEVCVGVMYRAWIWIGLVQAWQHSQHVEPVLLQSDLHPRGLTVITSAFIRNNLCNRRADWLDNPKHSATRSRTTHAEADWTQPELLDRRPRCPRQSRAKWTCTDCRWALEPRSLTSLPLTISQNYGFNCFLSALEKNRRCTCLWFSPSHFANKYNTNGINGNASASKSLVLHLNNLNASNILKHIWINSNMYSVHVVVARICS